MQAWWKTDRLWMKYNVFLAWIIFTVYEALVFKSVYVWLVTDIGNLQALGDTQMQVAFQLTRLASSDHYVQDLLCYNFHFGTKHVSGAAAVHLPSMDS